MEGPALKAGRAVRLSLGRAERSSSTPRGARGAARARPTRCSPSSAWARVAHRDAHAQPAPRAARRPTTWSPPTSRRCVAQARAPSASDRARRRPGQGLRPGLVRAAVSRALRRVRHRRAGHGVDGRRHGAPRRAAGRALVRLLPVGAAERADLQPVQRAHEGDLRRLAGRAAARRPGPLAPVGARHLGARRRCRTWCWPSRAAKPRSSALLDHLVNARRRERVPAAGVGEVADAVRLSRRHSASKSGTGWVVRDGGDAVVFGYGPWLLANACEAAERAREDDRRRASGSSTCRG